MLYIKCFFSLAILSLAGALVLKQAGSHADASVSHPKRSERILVRASHQGNDGVNLSDGRQLTIDYSGPAGSKNDLEQGRARPLALASADFDEDGVADLASGYAGSKGGIITLMRGNLDALYPNGPEAQRRRAQGAYTEEAFLSPARVFDVKGAPDFIAAGDFDADGHWDVAAAERGGGSLFLLRGDGAGALSLAEEIDLPGRVTAIVEGEINRADGLTDLVVAVVKDGAAQALVFEGPTGALRAAPEAIDLPAVAGSLALGRTDADGWIDLVVAAGRQLLSVRGRDRKLSLDEERRAEVRPANIERQSFPFSIRSITLGNFDGDNIEDVALLADEGSIHLTHSRGGKRARAAQDTPFASGRWTRASRLIRAGVSPAPTDDLLLLDSSNTRLHIVSARGDATSLEVEGGAAAVYSMRLNSDALNDLVILANGQSAPAVVKTLPTTVFTVTSAADSGPGTLRQAIMDANANPGADTINFSINSGVQTITVEKSLPTVAEAVTIDGTTQPGFTGSPIVELNGNEISADGFTIEGGHSLVRGLVINRFRGSGISLSITGNNVISGNFIGANVAGTENLPNLSSAVTILSGNNNLVGGTTAQARNLLAPTQSSGVLLDTPVMNTLVQGNLIGSDITGTVSLSSASVGVRIFGARNNVIGGTLAGAGNLISGNANFEGVKIGNSGESGSQASGNLVQGNLIGTNGAGTSALPNGVGVTIEDVPDSQIGGTTAAARNVVSGNLFTGISILGDGATGTLVQGNFIGTNAAGALALGNGITGIQGSFVSGSTIGGAAAGAGNVISGNSAGIFLGSLSKGNTVQGNFIGTDASGTAAIANTSIGVQIDNSISNLVGGTSAGTRNVISGNRTGLHLTGFNPTTNNSRDNEVQGNFIGTNASGTSPLGNLDDGIVIRFANSNTIGGAVAGMANTIAFNGRHGVNILFNNRNSVLSNSIFANQGMGINLDFSDQVTPNDPCDGDSGPNNLQNFPVITSVTSTAGSTTIQGTLNSSANMSYTIEFFVNASCDGSGFGEGQSLIGSTAVTTDAGCDASFNVTFPVPATGFITATATDSLGSTSEFSQCWQISGSCSYSVAPSSGFFAETGGEGGFNVLAPSGCDWAAVANNPWIAITSADGGEGNGVVNYLVRENPNAAGRQGTIQVAGLTFTINQRGTASEACTLSLSPGFGIHSAAGGGGSFNVATQPGCAWQAAVGVEWVTITSNSSGIGPGTVTYSVTTNTTLANRNTTIMVGGRAFSIKQRRN